MVGVVELPLPPAELPPTTPPYRGGGLVVPSFGYLDYLLAKPVVLWSITHLDLGSFPRGGVTSCGGFIKKFLGDHNISYLITRLLIIKLSLKIFFATWMKKRYEQFDIYNLHKTVRTYITFFFKYSLLFLTDFYKIKRDFSKKKINLNSDILKIIY